MKQKDYILAYNVIKSYKEKNENKGSLGFNYSLFKVQKLIQPQVEFQEEQERKIFNELNPEVKEDGVFDFGTPERKQEFFDKLSELGELEIENKEFDKPVIRLTEDVSLSIDDIAALDPFVQFK